GARARATGTTTVLSAGSMSGSASQERHRTRMENSMSFADDDAMLDEAFGGGDTSSGREGEGMVVEMDLGSIVADLDREVENAQGHHIETYSQDTDDNMEVDRYIGMDQLNTAHLQSS
ncbi:unnamed protein product, partial [Discosporangium mesarthrocarpum]